MLDADPKAIQQINSTGELDWSEGATMFFIIEEAKETTSDFLKGTVKKWSWSNFENFIKCCW